jgi:hypothetical protein
MSSFKGTLFGLILFVLFATLIITFAVDLGEEYGKSASEIGGGSLNLSAFEDSANIVNSSASGFRERFDEEGVVDNVDSPSGLKSIIDDMTTLITTPFKLLSQVLVNILGVPTIVANVLLGLLGIGLIFGIWRLLKQGY